jgi:hypothetical protein
MSRKPKSRSWRVSFGKSTGRTSERTHSTARNVVGQFSKSEFATGQQRDSASRRKHNVIRRILLSLILFPILTNAQSLAEVAKQQRARLCKEGKTQYCDDRSQKEKQKTVVDNSWMQQGLSYQKAEQASSGTQSAQQDLPTVGDLQSKLDDLANKTPRQLGEQFAGDIQFPGRDRWEQKLSTARDRLVARIQVVLDLVRSDKSTPTALNNAAYDMRLADTEYGDVQAEGQAKAADWKRKTDK